MQISVDDDDSVTDVVSVDDDDSVTDVEIDSSHDDDRESDQGDDEPSGNLGWMDAMSKVIKSGKARRSNKTIVLAKAKKLSSFKKALEKAEEVREAAKDEEARLKKLIIGRSKPNVLDYRKEKNLSKTAVRGIIQLFNAVNKHKLRWDQNDDIVTSKVKAKREMNKNSFLNLLADGNVTNYRSRAYKEESEIKGEIKEEVKEEDESPYNWKVLQNDFVGQDK